MVLVGGWVPDLLLADVEPPHVGSIDVDIALDAEKLNDGSYAELIQHKPKDTYDLCYCLDYHSDNMETLAEKWKQRLDDKKIVKAVQILREKFDSVNAFGPRQLVEFHNAADDETRAMHAQRALQLVQKFLSLL